MAVGRYYIVGQSVVVLFLFCPLIPVFAGDARRLGGEGRTVLFFVVVGGAEYISAAQVQQRDIGKNDQNIAQIGDRPHIAEVKPCDGTEDTKEGDENTEDADTVRERFSGGDSAGGDLREAEEADHTGESKQAEADGDQKDHDGVKHACARRQRGSGSQEFGQSVKFHPCFSAFSAPKVRHDHHKTRQRTDHDCVQENADGLHTALLAGVVCIGCTRSHGNSTLTGFVAHQATLDTLR